MFTLSHTRDGTSKRPGQGHRQAPGSALRQVEVEFESKAGNRALSLSPRQNSQLEVPPPCTPSIHYKDTRHTEVYFKKIIYKRPFASVFLVGFQLWEQGRCSFQDAGTSSRREPGEAWVNGVQRPRPLMVLGSSKIWDSPEARSSQTPGTRTEYQGPRSQAEP